MQKLICVFTDVDEKGVDWVGYEERKILYRPSKQFLENLREMEDKFKIFHGDELKSGSNILSDTIHCFKEANVHVEEDIMIFIVRCRIYFKIKILNSKRKQKMVVKGIKKMKKIMQ